MARLKYADGIPPLKNEHQGFTFQSARQANSALSSQKNDRARNARQTNRQVNLMRCTSQWRNMSYACKQNWIAFASAYPQACKNPVSGSLSGYQLFLKRNQYLFLNNGIEFDFMSEPIEPDPLPDAVEFVNDKLKWFLDCTDLYLMNFGILPSIGDKLLIRVISYETLSGQFFTSFLRSLTVVNLDFGKLVISAIVPDQPKKITYSIFLSRQKSQGESYVGSKCRYMGSISTFTLIIPYRFGRIYNQYTAAFPAGFHPDYKIPSRADFQQLATFAGGYHSISSGLPVRKLKETSSEWWLNFLTNTNELLFSGRGAGQQDPFLGSRNFKQSLFIWSATEVEGWSTGAWLQAIAMNFIESTSNKIYGYSIRLLKKDSFDPGQVTIDGEIYLTIKIGSQVWLQRNLSAKNFADGTPIPFLPNHNDWKTLTTPARSNPNDLESEV
jgi:uncharacterized protein (TIGR02145 family)